MASVVLIAVLAFGSEYDSGSLLQHHSAKISSHSKDYIDNHDTDELDSKKGDDDKKGKKHDDKKGKQDDDDDDDDDKKGKKGKMDYALDPCLAWNMSVKVIEDPRLLSDLDSSYSITKYQLSELGGFNGQGQLSALAPSKDKAWLFENKGNCVMAFMGTDSSGDLANNYNSTLIDKWGLTGLHAGVVSELEGLIAQMDFKTIHKACPGKFSVTGLSLGGALAQLFAVLVTSKHDPLHAHLHLHKLYTYGSYSALDVPASNAQAKDGCFEGSQYWYAQPNANGYQVDTVASPLVGGAVHDPVRSNKALVFSTGQPPVEFPCGTDLPAVDDLVTAIGYDQWIFFHTGYGFWLGCRQF